jgi:hypothetical protein
MCPTSAGDGNQFLFVNIEEFADMEVEEEPKPTTSPVMNTQPAVSFMPCVCPVLCSGQISSVACHSVCLCTEAFGLW